jgi:hypothetical protein
VYWVPAFKNVPVETETNGLAAESAATDAKPAIEANLTPNFMLITSSDKPHRSPTRKVYQENFRNLFESGGLVNLPVGF